MNTCVNFEAANCDILKVMGINVKIKIWLEKNTHDFDQTFEEHTHVKYVYVSIKFDACTSKNVACTKFHRHTKDDRW